jgi:hypothetical protein
MCYPDGALREECLDLLVGLLHIRDMRCVLCLAIGCALPLVMMAESIYVFCFCFFAAGNRTLLRIRR